MREAVAFEPTVGRPLDPREVVGVGEDEAPLAPVGEEPKRNAPPTQVLDHLRDDSSALVQSDALRRRHEHREGRLARETEHTPRLKHRPIEQGLGVGCAHERTFAPALREPADLFEHHVQQRAERLRVATRR